MDHSLSNDSNASITPFNGESFVEDLRSELQEIDAMQVGDHAQRFEALHQKLNQALSSIDGL
jgi:uncharacterized protein YukE